MLISGLVKAMGREGAVDRSAFAAVVVVRHTTATVALSSDGPIALTAARIPARVAVTVAGATRLRMRSPSRLGGARAWALGGRGEVVLGCWSLRRRWPGWRWSRRRRWLVFGGACRARARRRCVGGGGFARLPVPLRGLVSGTVGRSERVFWVRRAGAGFVLVNGAQGFSARFSDSGVRVSARGGRLALSLAGVGYGSSLRPLGSRAPSADGNRVSYADGALTQWFENGPLGLEQGFTLRAPPAGAARGPVTIALRVAGSLRARLVGGGEAVDFIAPGGGVVLRYVGLRAIDARGRVLRAWLDASGGRLLVRVDARGARYPLRIDPFVQQGAKLVGTGAAAGDANQGGSVALSSDGNTALVGAGVDDNGAGAAWVFTRSGRRWTQQGPKLVGTGAVGDASQGASVALSSDGNTALVGGSTTDNVRRGGGVGVHALGDDLDPAGPEARRHRRRRRRPAGLERGAVGRREHGARRRPRATTCEGAAWVFTRSGTTWTQQGPKLVGTGAVGDAVQGASVALSADGNTALVGGSGDTRRIVGAAWVFTRSGTTWTQQGPKLVGTGAVGDADQGYSVALSSDGNTALVGGPGDDTDAVGAAWVFTRSRGRWTQQGPKLVGTGAVARRRPGRQRGAVVRREHRARRRPGDQRPRGGGVGVHALGDDLDPAGLKARRHRRRRPRLPGLQRGAVGRREHGARRRPRRQPLRRGGVGVRQAAAAGHQDHPGQDQLEASPGHVQLQGDRHGNGLSVRARQDAEGVVLGLPLAEDLQAPEARQVHV